MSRRRGGVHIMSKLGGSPKEIIQRSAMTSAAPRVPVFISLTSIPSRVNKLGTVIDTLLNRQTVAATGVIVNLPKVYDKSLGQLDRVPTTWHSRGSTRLIINRNCRDMGPATKLLGCASVELPKNAVIIYLDDDHGYPHTLVEAHLTAHSKHPHTVFCGRGDVLAENGEIRQSFRDRQHMPVHLPCGVESVSISLEDVDLAQLLRDFRKLPREMLFCDDLMFGNWFAQRKLAVRLVPLGRRTRRLEQSNDESALCKGKRVKGRTTERYIKAIRAMRAGGEGVPSLHLKIHRTIQAGEMRLYVREDVNLRKPASSTAIVLFAWDRPDYFERTAESIRDNAGDRDVLVFIDGSVNLFSGTQRTDDAKVAKVAKIAKRVLGDRAVIVRAAYNYGVGLMQFFGMYSAFTLGYDRVLFCEDDLVLGKHYVTSVEALADTLLDRIPQLAAVQGGYRKESNDANAVIAADSYAVHMHYWGWLTTKDRFHKILPKYQAAAETLFWGVDYVLSKSKEGTPPYIEWFKRHNLKPKYRSQDWVRDGCFRLAGMPYKACCAKRRAAPIGEVGLHSTKERFKELELDSSTKDIHAKPPNLDKIVVHLPRMTIESHTASCYPQSITGVACFDHILRSIFPDVVRFKPGRKLRGGDRAAVIADNHFVLDVPRGTPAIIVHHGIAQLHGERDLPWKKKNQRLITAQAQMLLQRNPKNTAIVSCSKFCTDSFSQRNRAYAKFPHHSIPHTSALPQVPTKRRSIGEATRPVIVGDWRFPHKGKDLMGKLTKLLPDFEFRQMAIGPPKPFDAAKFAKRKVQFYREADMALVLSSHEGNSYFLLDALQMDLVCVSTDVGLAPELPNHLIANIDWRRSMVDRDVRYVAESIRAAWENRQSPGVVNAYVLDKFGRQKYAVRTLKAILSVARPDGPEEGEKVLRPAPAQRKVTSVTTQRVGRGRRVR